jgi:hypothetical protein
MADEGETEGKSASKVAARKKPPGGVAKSARPAPMMSGPRPRGPAMTKAELRAQAEKALAAATKPIVKLPTKLVRQCGRCGELNSVMVEPGEAAPPFKCKSCDAPAKG